MERTNEMPVELTTSELDTATGGKLISPFYPPADSRHLNDLFIPNKPLTLI